MSDTPRLPTPTMSIEAPRLRRAKGFDWDHEVQVALPASYHLSEKSYPVLWVTDGNLMFELAWSALQGMNLFGEAPEMIVVGVGCPRDTDGAEFGRRRGFDFSPAGMVTYKGVGGDMMEAGFEANAEIPTGGGPAFLDFLVDDLRGELSAEYRMDPDDHGLFGLSGGGMFVGLSIFQRPEAFAKYICGSPSLNAGDFRIFEMEEQYAAAHQDLNCRIYFGAGETEIDDFSMSMWSIVGSMVRMAELLRLRQYPSLQLYSRIFPGESHVTVTPVLLTWAIRTLWADVIKPAQLSAATAAASEQ